MRIEDKRIILLGGPGGVGKTSLAAALGIALSQRGHRTLVLTVDPARRLAQALGLDNFSFEVERIQLPNPDHVLFASMLDSERYFDRLIARLARNPEQRERIIKNPLYRTMVDSLGGTHEYAAMERLLEFAKDDRFDKIIVDTPPTQNAVELFSAPLRLAQFMDTSVLKWFQGQSPRYLQWFRSGTQLAMRFLEKIFGGEFLSRFSAFLRDLEGLEAGFRSRHLEVIETLRSSESTFLLVTLPTETRLIETKLFLEALKEFGLEVHKIILNRIEKPLTEKPIGEDSRELLHYHESVVSTQKYWIQEFSQTFSRISFVDREGYGIADQTTLSLIGERILTP